MAVVSLSRIQVRRGKKEQGEGLPQLASGEFGWAIDAQELYIGNGAVSEGAPAIGNTMVLTEHSNLFELSNYTYLNKSNIQTGPSFNNAVYRLLQERLDDRVSVKAFGAEGNGTVQTVELQRAIDQLYLNPATRANPESRVTLWIEPGHYKIDNTLYIPPFATLVGAGIGKTIIETTGDFEAFRTVDGSSTIGNPADGSTNTLSKQAREILISGMTIKTTNKPGLIVDSCRDSLFKDLELEGTWEFETGVDYDEGTSAGIRMLSISSEVTCKNNLFTNVRVNKYAISIFARYDISNNVWEHCRFTHADTGILLGTTFVGFAGLMLGPMNNIVTNSVFDDILKEGVIVINGSGNLSITNRYYNVGNDGGSPDNNRFAIVSVRDPSNASIGDWFMRTTNLGSDSNYLFGVPYRSEVLGPVITDSEQTLSVSVTEQNQFSRLFKLPVDNRRGYSIEYVYKSDSVSALRSGTLTIAVDPINETASITDDYDYTGDIEFAENLEFSTDLLSETGIVDSSGIAIDAIAITMRNTTDNDSGTIYYKVKTKT